MSEDPADRQTKLADAVRLRAERRKRWLREGEPSLTRNLGQIGALGWTITVPILIGLAAGRWLDHRFATGIFWTAPLIMTGAVIGGWSAWRWLSRR